MATISLRTILAGVTFLALQACGHQPATEAGDITGSQDVQCGSERGHALGAVGAAYPDDCPADSHPAFARAFDSGQQLLELQAGISVLEQSLAERHRDLLDLKSTAYEMQAILINAPPTMDRRLRILLELRDIAAQETEIEREIARLSAERDMQRHLLASLQMSLSNS